MRSEQIMGRRDERTWNAGLQSFKRGEVGGIWKKSVKIEINKMNTLIPAAEDFYIYITKDFSINSHVFWHIIHHLAQMKNSTSPQPKS